MTLRAFLIAIAVLLSAVTAQAVQPGEMLADPVLEARAREVSKALRCVQCQNETIDESNAEIAHGMRVLVRQRIGAGDTNDQVIAYMVGRYGDYVSMKPRFTGLTALLWCGPAGLLLLGFFAVRRRVRRRAETPTPLSAEEAADLAALDTVTRS